MKLLSLNIWGGKAYEPLMEFIKEQSRDADIFCFQEVFRSSSDVPENRGWRVNIFSELTEMLADFNGYFAPEQDGWDFLGPVDFDASFGQATFVRKSYQVNSEGNVFVYRNRNEGITPETFPANFQYVRFAAGNKKFVLVNLHGISEPGSKLDTPDRIKQSEKIIEFLNSEKGAKILCGDFNLLPETQSIAMFENMKMTNLIKTYHIPETRSWLSPFYGKPGYLPFADYVFISPEIAVKNFKVFDVAVSDHLPMILEFE